MPDDPKTRAAAALRALFAALPPEERTPEKMAALALRVVEQARLQVANRRDKKRGMHAAERVQLSKGQGDDDPEGLRAKANAAGLTLRSLAAKLKAEGWRCSQPYISQCLRGDSRIRRTLAERIQALTGFEASKANWPAGWAREPNE